MPQTSHSTLSKIVQVDTAHISHTLCHTREFLQTDKCFTQLILIDPNHALLSAMWYSSTQCGHDGESWQSQSFWFNPCHPLRLYLMFWMEHNDWVRSKINFLVGSWEPLLATVKKWKLTRFGHVMCHNSRPKTILQGTMEGG